MSTSWIWIKNAQLHGHTLNTKGVIDKPNLDILLYSNIRYDGFQSICTSFDYVEQLCKIYLP